jgi:hypothetical protein
MTFPGEHQIAYLTYLGFSLTDQLEDHLTLVFFAEGECLLAEVGRLNAEDLAGATALYQRPAAEDDPLTLWDDLLYKLESNGFSLRNISYPDFAPAGRFTDLMPERDQKRWLEDVRYRDKDGDRPDSSAMRARYEGPAADFIALPLAGDSLDLLKYYVQAALPAYRRSEARFWSLNVLPQSSHPRVTIYARIHLYQQEVFTLGAYHGGELFCSWHLSKSIVEKAYGERLSRLRFKFWNLETYDHAYDAGGPDQMNIEVRGKRAGLRVLKDPALVAAMRRFNLGLVRKGPCLTWRYHNLALADLLV